VFVPFARESQQQKRCRSRAQQQSNRKAARDTKGSPQVGFAHAQDHQGGEFEHER
jgi:hypothetical protein